MQEHITKHSPVLGKDAVYTKTVILLMGYFYLSTFVLNNVSNIFL